MFTFKQFTIRQDCTAMKVGTDGVLLGAWAEGGDAILDIGTGTGVVALMMAQRFHDARITAVELDPDAARQAAENAAASPFASRVRVVAADIRAWAQATCPTECSDSSENSDNSEPSERSFTSIVANPPYYEHTLPSRNGQRDMARSAETLSFADLMTAARSLLAPQGTLSLVAPAAELEHLEAEAALRGLYIKERVRVKTVARKPPKRVLLAFSPERPAQLRDETVVLQGPDGQRSPWYQALTQDFYL